MILQSLWQSIENSSLSQSIASSEVAFPLIETFHVFAVVTVIGTIAIMDLRLLGLTSRKWTASSISRDTLWLTWLAFLVAVITGLLMFVSKAATYMVNPWFLVKMAMLAAAGINMAVLHRGPWRAIASWDSALAVPGSVRLSAALSLTFWIVVIFCGRFIGFTLGVYQPPL
ncbi:MAG: hypothetical protein J7498_15165 [Sphingobium sp.]|nr:hypothetical protein [Sphingobium sp.]